MARRYCTADCINASRVVGLRFIRADCYQTMRLSSALEGSLGRLLLNSCTTFPSDAVSLKDLCCPTRICGSGASLVLQYIFGLVP